MHSTQKPLYLTMETTQAAILTTDLIGVEATFVDIVRQAIEERTRIPAGNVMISCSHTHFGPEVRVSRATSPDNPKNRVYANMPCGAANDGSATRSTGAATRTGLEPGRASRIRSAIIGTPFVQMGVHKLVIVCLTPAQI